MWRSSARARNSAALSPRVGSIRMSSGPSKRNEKPRPGSSICGDDTPRSSRTPLTCVMPSEASVAVIAENAVCSIVKRGSAAKKSSRSVTSASTASGRRTLRCCKAEPDARSEAEILERIRHRRLHHLGLVRGMALRIPELEVAAHAEQHDVANEAGGSTQLGGDEDARR